MSKDIDDMDDMDLGDDDLDIGDIDLDFGDMGDAIQDDNSGPRSPVNTAIDTSRTFVDEFTDDKVKTMLDVSKAAIPTSLSRETDVIVNTYDTIADEVKKQGSSLKSEARKSLRAIKTIVPGGDDSFLGRAVNSLYNMTGGDEDNNASQGPSQSEKIALEVANMMGQKASSDQEAEAFKEQLEFERQKEVKDIQATTSLNVERMRKFMFEVSDRYYRASLDVNFRQLYTMQELVSITKSGFDIFKTALESIVKNTALPDVVKVKNSEVMQKMLTERLLTSAGTSMFQSDPFKVLANKAKTIVSDIGSSATDAIGQIGGYVEQGESLGEMGLKPSQLFAMMAADAAKSKAGKLIAKHLEKTDKGQAGIWEVKNAVADPRSYLRKIISEDGPMAKAAEVALLGMGTGNSNFKITKTDPNEPASLDNRTKDSINKIIPQLLSKIYAEVRTAREQNTNAVGGPNGFRRRSNPKDNELVYDNARQEFVTRAQVRESVHKEISKGVNKDLVPNAVRVVNEFTKDSVIEFSKEELKTLRDVVIEGVLKFKKTSAKSLFEDRNFIELLATKDPVLANKVKTQYRAFKRRVGNDPTKAGLETINNGLNSILTHKSKHEHIAKDLVDRGLTDEAIKLGLISRDDDNNITGNRDSIISDLISKARESDVSNVSEPTSGLDINLRDIRGTARQAGSLFRENLRNRLNDEEETGSYSKGGYTGDGDKEEVAGIVHKSEYVIPKEMLSKIVKFIDKEDDESVIDYIKKMTKEVKAKSSDIGKSGERAVNNIVNSKLYRDTEKKVKESQTFNHAVELFTSAVDKIKTASDTMSESSKLYASVADMFSKENLEKYKESVITTFKTTKEVATAKASKAKDIAYAKAKEIEELGVREFATKQTNQWLEDVSNKSKRTLNKLNNYGSSKVSKVGVATNPHISKPVKDSLFKLISANNGKPVDLTDYAKLKELLTNDELTKSDIGNITKYTTMVLGSRSVKTFQTFVNNIKKSEYVDKSKEVFTSAGSKLDVFARSRLGIDMSGKGLVDKQTITKDNKLEETDKERLLFILGKLGKGVNINDPKELKAAIDKSKLSYQDRVFITKYVESKVSIGNRTNSAVDKAKQLVNTSRDMLSLDRKIDLGSSSYIDDNEYLKERKDLYAKNIDLKDEQEYVGNWDDYTEDQQSTLRFEFFSSPEYKSRHITNFALWLRDFKKVDPGALGTRKGVILTYIQDMKNRVISPITKLRDEVMQEISDRLSGKALKELKLDQEEHMRKAFFNSSEYKEGLVHSFDDWLETQGYRRNGTGVVGRIKKALSLKTLFRKTRALDRKIMGGLYKGLGKGLIKVPKIALRGAGSIATNTARGAVGAVVNTSKAGSYINRKASALYDKIPVREPVTIVGKAGRIASNNIRTAGRGAFGLGVDAVVDTIGSIPGLGFIDSNRRPAVIPNAKENIKKAKTATSSIKKEVSETVDKTKEATKEGLSTIIHKIDKLISKTVKEDKGNDSGKETKPKSESSMLLDYFKEKDAKEEKLKTKKEKELKKKAKKEKFLSMFDKEDKQDKKTKSSFVKKIVSKSKGIINPTTILLGIGAAIAASGVTAKEIKSGVMSAIDTIKEVVNNVSKVYDVLRGVPTYLSQLPARLYYNIMSGLSHLPFMDKLKPDSSVMANLDKELKAAQTGHSLEFNKDDVTTWTDKDVSKLSSTDKAIYESYKKASHIPPSKDGYRSEDGRRSENEETFSFDQHSRELLYGTKDKKGVQPITAKLAELALSMSTIYFSITTGSRTAAEQHQAYLSGNSKLDGIVKKSLHQSGLALDIYPRVKVGDNWLDMYNIKNPSVKSIWNEVYNAFAKAADKLGLKLRYGYTFNDWPHIAIVNRKPNPNFETTAMPASYDAKAVDGYATGDSGDTESNGVSTTLLAGAGLAGAYVAKKTYDVAKVGVKAGVATYKLGEKVVKGTGKAAMWAANRTNILDKKEITKPEVKEQAKAKVNGVDKKDESKLKKLANKVKKKIISKLGPKAAVKLLATIASKLSPWGIAFSIGSFLYYLAKTPNKPESAASQALIGIDVFDDEEPKVDNKDNIIPITTHPDYKVAGRGSRKHDAAKHISQRPTLDIISSQIRTENKQHKVDTGSTSTSQRTKSMEQFIKQEPEKPVVETQQPIYVNTTVNLDESKHLTTIADMTTKAVDLQTQMVAVLGDISSKLDRKLTIDGDEPKANDNYKPQQQPGVSPLPEPVVNLKRRRSF